MEALAAWIVLKANIVFAILCAQLILTDSSPLSTEKRSDNSACYKGWIHYQRFCVTQAKGESDAAVAFYCGGFGGVGINGYCITKAHKPEDMDHFQTSSDESGSLAGDLWRADAYKTVEESSSLGDLINTSEGGNDVIEGIACPKGWKHYGKICVYQPIPLKEQCHLLNAVAFSGFCLKHADTDAVEKRGLKYDDSAKDKRVCCCAHVRGKSNGYGCM